MTQPAPAVAPYVPTYANRTPYITSAEFLASATGVDTSQLVPGGGVADNAAALGTLIRRASSYADQLCHQVLAATSDLVAGEYRVFRDGTIRVPVDYTPIVAVTGVALGWRAGQLQAMSDLSGLWLSRKTVRIPVTCTGTPYSLTGLVAPAAPGRVFAQVTYVNGYANTTLAAAAVQGAQSVTPVSTLGIFAGMPLNVYDGASTEQATVAASYVPGAAVVPLTAPLAFAHAAGVSVSALPDAIKQAVINLTTFLIKTRGSEAITFDAVGGPAAHAQQFEAGSVEEYDIAVDLLTPFRRVT